MTGTFTIYEIALNYASEWGWAVFPLHTIRPDGACSCGRPDCKSPGKHPRTARGVLDASKDPDQISAWFEFEGDDIPNIGIATGSISGLVVVDIDTVKGAKSGELVFGGVDQSAFSTPKVKTGAGLHLYYRYPISGEVRNSASKLAPFIDVRGDGGYVVAPPSKHVSGATYSWLNPECERLLDFPDDWAQRLRQPSKTDEGAHSSQNGGVSANGTGLHAPPLGGNLHVPDAIAEGSRNQTMAKLAGKMRRMGMSEGSIASALLVENQRICKPPLDDDEVRKLAWSIARYKADEPLEDALEDEADYENTLKPYMLGAFLNAQFEEKEILGFHIGKRDIAILQAATNAGKTSLLRNAGLCMAAGRPFEPFFEGARPVRVAYFDFENDAQDVQRDLRTMCEVFTPRETAILDNNFIVIPKGLMGGELFQFNTHEIWANSLIQTNDVEFIIVDNVSAAYDLNDENSNAEVTRKVIKPLLKMAFRGNCAFLFAHHYGKGKNEIEHAGVHAGRGASALQSLSRTVINMFGDVSKGEPVTVECAKRKTDGGQQYRRVFKLNDDRWFHSTTIVPPPKKKTAYTAVRDLVGDIDYPKTISTAAVIQALENEFEPNSIKKVLNDLYKDGFIDRPKHGSYCSKTESVEAPKVKNYYEKDDD